jgi:hypothetical protein
MRDNQSAMFRSIRNPNRIFAVAVIILCIRMFASLHSLVARVADEYSRGLEVLEEESRRHLFGCSYLSLFTHLLILLAVCVKDYLSNRASRARNQYHGPTSTVSELHDRLSHEMREILIKYADNSQRQLDNKVGRWR